MKYGSVEHRKKIAEVYGLDAQEIINLPRNEFERFVAGLEIGYGYAVKKLLDAFKAEEEQKEHSLK